MIPGENSIFGDIMHKCDESLLSTPQRMTGRDFFVTTPWG